MMSEGMVHRRKHCWNRDIVFWVAVVFLVHFTSFAGESAAAKKAIVHTWETLWATPEIIEKHLERLETLPFDGISESAWIRERGKEQRIALYFLSDEAYSWEGMKDTLHCWKKTSRRMKHNFAITFWTPQKRLRWDDDKAWDRAAANLGLMARLARESGFKGILMDPEDYYGTAQYTAQSDEDFAAVSKLARKRGRQLMKSMAREYPDITLLSFYLLNNDHMIFNTYEDPLTIVRRSGSSWPSLVNGMLDELPAEARIVDASEYAYRAEFDCSDLGFDSLAYDIRYRAQALVAPENREKYRRQVQVGFGLYLDPYAEGGSGGKKQPFNGSRFKRMFNNFCEAMRIADEYCWFYGEGFCLVDWDRSFGWTRKGTPTWERKLPGFSDAVRFAKTPGPAAQRWLAESRTDGSLPKSLVVNPECKPDGKMKTDVHREKDWAAANLPDGWAFWQSAAYEGKGTYGQATGTGQGDSWSVTATGTGNACFINTVPVIGGEWYVTESFCRGGSRPQMTIRWQNKDGWMASYLDLIFPFGPATGKEWRRRTGVVRTPVGATRMVVLLFDCLGKGQNSTVWFDSLNVWHLPSDGKLKLDGKPES